jgi:hypothetical protein
VNTTKTDVSVTVNGHTFPDGLGACSSSYRDRGVYAREHMETLGRILVDHPQGYLAALAFHEACEQIQDGAGSTRYRFTTKTMLELSKTEDPVRRLVCEMVGVLKGVCGGSWTLEGAGQVIGRAQALLDDPSLWGKRI